MFADDTQLLNKNEESVEQSFLILSKFEKASGSKINYKKTKGLFIGRLRVKRPRLTNISWISDNIKTLGVFHGYNIDTDDIWKQIINKMKSCTDSKYVMWFKCSEQLFKTDQPVFFGVVYIPPEYTKYSSEDAFSELQQEYLSFSNKSKYVCLLGDFNARTATDTDFVDLIKNRYVDDYITDFVDNFTNVLNDLKMPLNRISMDKSKNKFGNLLLNFCKGNSMFIVNGRVGNDKNIGRFTCRNASVVDYCITSPELLKLFFDFDILESSKLFSDVHAPLHILLSVNLNNNDSNSNTVRKTNPSKAKIKSGENEKVTDFQENIDEKKLHTFEQKLSRWQNEIGVTDQAIIDSLLEDLGNIFTGSAKKTFGTFNCKNIESKINKNKNGQNQNLGLTKTVNLPDKNIENLRDVIS